MLQIQSHHCFDRLAWLFKTAPTEIACRVVRPSVPVERAVQVTAVYPPGIVAGISIALGMGTTRSLGCCSSSRAIGAYWRLT